MELQEPLFQRIARELEDQILSGKLPEGAATPSAHMLSKQYGVNPATAGKGLRLLGEQGVLSIRRGQGYYVVSGAQASVLERRRRQFEREGLRRFLEEGRRLGFTRKALIRMMKKEEDA